MNNKISVLALSGWAQKHDCLNNIFDNQDFDVVNFDYSRLESVDDVFKGLKSLEINPRIIIGWSLGGQLAVRMIEAGIFNPDLFVSLSTPFQFVKSRSISAAMSVNAFNKFRDDFVNSPDQTLKKFSILTIMNDRNAKDLISNLDVNENNHQQLIFWLKELERFSCFDVDFSNFPKTLLIHGFSDVIVHVNQSEVFCDRIENSKLEIFKNCGHAPHLNDLNRLRLIIRQEIMS